MFFWQTGQSRRTTLLLRCTICVLNDCSIVSVYPTARPSRLHRTPGGRAGATGAKLAPATTPRPTDHPWFSFGVARPPRRVHAHLLRDSGRLVVKRRFSGSHAHISH